MVPALVTLTVMLWGIRKPSYTRDEAATLSAVQRSFPELLRMLAQVDAVHGAYYLAMWPVVRLAGSGELATRLPSALAMAAASAAVAGLGRRLVAPRAGLAAGLVFATLPMLSLFGQTARPYAMATALAAAASYLLVRAMRAAASGAGVRGWLTGYAACLAALGYMHPFALLLVPAHAVPMARAWLRRADGTTGRSLAPGWLAAAVGAVALASPLIAESATQHVSLSWMRNPATLSIIDLTNLIGPRQIAAAAGLAVLGAIAAGAVAGRARLQASWPGDLLALCLPWLILPAAILIGISLISPVYVFRYILFCAPAAALLVGAALAAIGWTAGTAAFAIITMLAVPAQLQVRSADGHGDDIRAADQIVAENMRPGDVILYKTFGEPIGAAYPYGLGQLRNVEVAGTPVQSGTLGGMWARAHVIRHWIAEASGVWLVQLTPVQSDSPHDPRRLLRKLDFRLIRTWHAAGIRLSLYVHQGTGCPGLERGQGSLSRQAGDWIDPLASPWRRQLSLAGCATDDQAGCWARRMAATVWTGFLVRKSSTMLLTSSGFSCVRK
jgi:mannosyltransferase